METKFIEQDSWDIEEIQNYLAEEPWVITIAKNENRTFENIQEVVENFICKYYLMSPREVTSQDIKDLFKIAKNTNQ